MATSAEINKMHSILQSQAICLRVFDCRKIIAYRCLGAYYKTNKALFSSQTQKVKRGLVNSKEQSQIVTSTDLPKLQEFRNENAVTWKPSSLWFRHSYIIKHLLRRFSQPMIARLLKTARSLQILQEIGQIPCHRRVFKEKNFRFGLSWKNVLIGLTLTCDVSRENWSNL